MSETQCPEPGIYDDVPFEEYCRWPAVNNSSLGPALRSAAHYRYALDNPREDTDAFRFGRLCHEGRLEPAAVLDKYAVMPDLTQGILVNGQPAKSPRSTSEYKRRVADWQEKHQGRLIVEQTEFDQMKGVLNALWQCQRTRDWFAGPGKAEASIVWKDSVTGLTCKARIDKVITDQTLADLKTTRDAGRFEKGIAEYGYDRQAAFYLDGWRTLTGLNATFNIAAVEKDAPFGVRAAPFSPRTIAIGRAKYREAMERIAEALAHNQFPGYADTEFFDLPLWADQPLTLICGGMPFEVN